MLCFVVVMQSFILNSHEVFIHIHQGCFAGTGAIVRLPQCQWSKPDGYGKISQCITTTKHSRAKTVCIFLKIYCSNDYDCIKSTCFGDFFYKSLPPFVPSSHWFYRYLLLAVLDTALHNRQHDQLRIAAITFPASINTGFNTFIDLHRKMCCFEML